MSLIAIQQKIGVAPDGSFGPKTAKAIQGYLNLSDIHTAHFLGQCSHETGGWRIFEENLSYSKEALLNVFPKYFNVVQAETFARKPFAIAEKVYGGRMGNNQPGDGWKYRGRGAIQTTGKANYTAFSREINHPDIIENPDSLKDMFALESALFFFDNNRVFDKARDVSPESILAVSLKVNGGYNGLKDREEWTKKIYSWITI
jgi:putative chitinase